MSYPILEHDPTALAFIEPAQVIRPRDTPEHCVICFFRDVIERVIAEHGAKVAVENSWEDGPHALYEIAYQGRRLAFYHPGVGAPLAAGLMEEAIAFGCRKFMACGGCGSLVREVTLGHLIAVSGAVRDEGTSYHYLPPGREVEADPLALQALVQTLVARNLPHRLGKTWTTDAPYRETAPKIARRRDEGCVTVEMEAAAMMAVAQFRGARFGQLLYGGDDLSGSAWDNRDWQRATEVRERLFWLCADACLML